MLSATSASLSHKSILFFQKSNADTGFPLPHMLTSDLAYTYRG